MFPIQKNGHEYSFREGSFLYRSPAGREVDFPFSERLKLKISPWTGALRLKGPQGTAPLSPLSEAERRDFLTQLFQRWKSREPEAAKKAAFDYIEGQRQFLPIAFIACLLVGMPVGVALMNDSREQYVCTNVLKSDSAVGTMNVTKFRKKRKGHYVLTLEFTTPQGPKIVGTDQLIMGKEGVEEEMERNIPKTVPVVYSPSRPECWSLTPEPTSTEVNWAKRRYFTAFSLLFGLFFVITSVYGLAWSAASWMRRRRPFREDLAGMFQL